MSQNQKPLHACDIGGTKTVLALYDPAIGPYEAIAQAVYPSREYASLEAIVGEFLKDRNGSVCRASFGIAGPVADGRVQATNLPWAVEESRPSAPGWARRCACSTIWRPSPTPCPTCAPRT